MTPERLRQIETLFHAIRERTADDRAAALAAACGDDAALRQEVESLLAQPEDVMVDGSMAGMAAGVASSLGVRRRAVGDRIGGYVLGPLLGAGGMGEVYRARDTTLGREVAIKILPDLLATDPDRLARFEREARTLASLNHPHIGAIYGIADDGRVRGLVLELVDGDTLADRLAGGRLAISDALNVAIQIADALEAAHETGIIHRDLKPANIKIAPAGAVKVLDFGLAKAVTHDKPHGETTPSLATRDGAILGTAAYMSPEQARGLAVDKRTDIWAFGCVLYEMLAGRRAFACETHSDTIAAVLQSDPEWPALPADTPTVIERLLRRCLEKDPRRRLRDIGDARLEIGETLATTSAAAPDLRAREVSSARPSHRARWLVTGLCLVTAIASGVTVGLIRSGSGASVKGVARVLVGVSPADELMREPTRTQVVLSPDGKTLVFSAVKGGRQALYTRPIDRLEATAIPGTEKSDSPFFSPDGAWLGFWSGEIASGAVGELKKVPLRGGPVMRICRTAPLFGASWSASDEIVFANSAGGLWTVSAAGGTPRPLTTIDQSRREQSHRLPHVLPGGRAVLFTIVKELTRWDEAEIVALTLATGERTLLIEGGADPRYISTGHVAYARSGALMAVPFDVTRLRVTGPPVGVIDGVMHAENAPNVTLRETGAAQFSISASGDLAYIPGGVFPNANRSLVWVGRDGRVMDTLPVPPRPYLGARLSPDGKRVAVGALGSGGIWIFDLERRALTQLTPEVAPWLAWTPDSMRVTSTSRAPMHQGLFSISVDGSVTPKHLFSPIESSMAGSWSPDGSQLAFTKFRETASNEIWIWSREKGEHKLRQASGSPVNERYPVFSPDGHWIAYVTDESGGDEVYVQRYPDSDERHQVSTQGGIQPMGARNGQEIFYTVRDAHGTKMMAVGVPLGPTFSAGAPRLLFEGSYSLGSPHRNNDVTPDGTRFLMMQPIPVADGPPLTHMILVQNWSDELRQRAPARR